MHMTPGIKRQEGHKKGNAATNYAAKVRSSVYYAPLSSLKSPLRVGQFMRPMHNYSFTAPSLLSSGKACDAHRNNNQPGDSICWAHIGTAPGWGGWNCFDGKMAFFIVAIFGFFLMVLPFVVVVVGVVAGE